MSSFSISRISDPLKNHQLTSQLRSHELSLQRLYDQLSTGNRVTSVGDDPVAASRAMSLQRGISRAEQLSRNSQITQGFYAATDIALGTLGDVLIAARGATVEAAQNVLSDDEREAIAAGLDQAVRTAVEAANSVFREHQLLGGHLQPATTLLYQEGAIVFSGNDMVGETFVGWTAPIATGVSGVEAFGLAAPIISGSDLQPAVTEQTLLSDLRNGRGINSGVIRLSAGEDWVEVDLRRAGTVGDVTAALEAVSFDGRQLDVQVTADGLQIAYADGLGGTLAIDDLPGGQMAADLAIRNRNALSATPIVATGLAPRVTANTPLQSLVGGAGVDLSAGLQIRQGDKTFGVDLSAAQTVGDVLVEINRSGAQVRGEITADGRSIAIRGLASGVTYSVGENGGQAATLLGVRTGTAQTPLASLNQGLGITLATHEADLLIQRTDGSQLALDLENLETIGQVLDRINDHPDNQDAARVTASLNASGTGITLTTVDGSDPLVVRSGGSSNAAIALGLVPAGQTSATATSQAGVSTLIGNDYAPRHAGGAIDTLIRLAAAVRAGDVGQIEQLQPLLDQDREQALQVRGRVGVWSQELQRMQDAADTNAIELKGQLSNEVEADFASVISEIKARETAREASLRMIAESARMTLLDFL